MVRSQAVKHAQQQARQAHLEDIAVTFHVLFSQHSIVQAWHSTAQHAKHERSQQQQQAAEQQAGESRQAAAIKFHDLYTRHRCWKQWLGLVQQGRAEKELSLQHAARQQSIQRFVQVTMKMRKDICLGCLGQICFFSHRSRKVWE